MYINDVHILYYAVAAIIGAVIGGFINWCNLRLPENQKIFSKDMLDKTKRTKTQLYTNDSYGSIVCSFSILFWNS